MCKKGVLRRVCLWSCGEGNYGLYIYIYIGRGWSGGGYPWWYGIDIFQEKSEWVEKENPRENTILRLGVGLNPVDGRLIDSSSRPCGPASWRIYLLGGSIKY